MRGAPFVGYVAQQGGLPIFIRATALTHLIDIVEKAATPDPQLLFEEFMTKQDLQLGCAKAGLACRRSGLMLRKQTSAADSCKFRLPQGKRKDPNVIRLPQSCSSHALAAPSTSGAAAMRTAAW